jgi:hypothetical protein
MYMARKLAEFLNIFFGMRKFILMGGLLFIGIIFRIQGMLSGSEFVDLLKATTISFFAANSGEHALVAIKSYMDAKGKSPAPSDDAVAQVDEDDSVASTADTKATS